MQVVHERCAGLDVHKKVVVAAVITPEGRETDSFTTTTRSLLRMRDWLLQKGCTHVAMESTGVYWKPIFNLMEDAGLDLLLVNAHQCTPYQTGPGSEDGRQGRWVDCPVASAWPAAW